LTAAALLFVVAAIAGVAWLMIVYPGSTPPQRGRHAMIDLGAGTGIDDVTAQLADAGIIDRRWAFAAYLRLLGAGDRLRTGAITVDDSMTPSDLVRQIATGYGYSIVRVTIPEGYTRFDVARRLEERRICTAADFLAATADPAVNAAHGIEAETLEGYLFPDTYELREDTPARAVVDRMVEAFQRRAIAIVEENPDGLAALSRDLGWQLHDVVTLASIVEKEAAAPEERPIIAGVFLNRLRSDTFRPQRLQADPTVSYGCLHDPSVSAACRAFDGRDITRAMLGDLDNPYNTYRRDKLPPGPIANPGAASIRAVLDPAEHDYLYFVARGGGRHAFSATLDEHNAAVRQHVLGSGGTR
jgi:UPF0755 protein